MPMCSTIESWLSLRSQLIAVATLLFSAVCSPLGKPCIALSADHPLLVVLLRELEEIWRDAVGVAATAGAAAQPQD